jgi:hypothetical protein
MKLLISFVLLFSSLYAHADIRVGNGGDVIACPGKFELLDYYEARTQRSENLDLLSSASTIDAQVAFALSRLSQVSPHRAEMYKAWYTEFYQQAFFLSGTRFVDIPDSDHIAFPSGCTVEQAIVQVQNPLPGQRRYTINGDLWEKLNEETRAGLILHEIVYREAISYGHKNSIAARYLTGFLASDKMNSITQSDFAELLRQLEFRRIDFNGLWLMLEYNGQPAPFRFDDSGRLRLVFVDPIVPFERQNARFLISEFGRWGFGENSVQGPYLSFHSNGLIASFACEQQCGPFPFGESRASLNSETKIWTVGETELDMHGRIKFANQVGQSIRWRQAGNEVSLPAGQILEARWNEQGVLISLQLGDFPDGVRWSLGEDQWIRCESPHTMETMQFFDSGQIRSCRASQGRIEIDGNRVSNVEGLFEQSEQGQVLKARSRGAIQLSNFAFKVVEFQRTHSGEIQYVELAEDARLKVSSTHGFKIFRSGDKLRFDHEGLVDRKCQNSMICFEVL